jgi:hypothetical protein
VSSEIDLNYDVFPELEKGRQQPRIFSATKQQKGLEPLKGAAGHHLLP